MCEKIILLSYPILNGLNHNRQPARTLRIMKKRYKIGDLPEDMNLIGCKLNGQYIFSGWSKGFWVRNHLKEGQIFPIFFKDFDEIKNWKVEVPPDKVLLIGLKP